MQQTTKTESIQETIWITTVYNTYEHPHEAVGDYPTETEAVQAGEEATEDSIRRSSFEVHETEDCTQ